MTLMACDTDTGEGGDTPGSGVGNIGADADNTTSTMGDASGGEGDAASPSVNPDWWKTGEGFPGGPRINTLVDVDGDVTLSESGQVYAGYRVHGNIVVSAPNVTIRDSIANGISNQSSGLIVEYATIVGPGLDAAVQYSDYTLRYTEVRGTFDGLKLFQNTTLENVWVHDMVRGGGPHPSGCAGSGNSEGGYTHNDGAQISGGSHIRISHSRFENTGYNSGIFIDPDQGTIDDVVIDSTYFQGGNFAFWVVDSASDPSTGVPTNLTLTHSILGAPYVWGAEWAGYFSVQNQKGEPIPINWSDNQGEYWDGAKLAYEALPSAYPQAPVPVTKRSRNP